MRKNSEWSGGFLGVCRNNGDGEMEHFMKLAPGPFAAMAAGTKTVELRLNDPKRQAVQPGDTLIFTEVGTERTLRVAVLDRADYPDFFALYPHFDPMELGYAPGATARPEDMFDYYSKGAIEKYGALALRVRRMEEDAL